jgi:hypothetical protein
MTYGVQRSPDSWSKYDRSVPGRLAVHGQVVVGAVGDALELAPLAAGEVELVLDVDGALGVVRQLLLRVLEQRRRSGSMPWSTYQAKRSSIQRWCHCSSVAGLDEELHLHLLELAGAEDEVAGRDLVAEALADLADAERRLLARRLLHVEVVDEDALRGLGRR